MGRAVLKISEGFIGLALRSGVPASRPIEFKISDPVSGATWTLSDPGSYRVVEVRFDESRGLVELMLDGDRFPGSPEASFITAPVLEVVIFRIDVPETAPVLALVADHVRNSEAFCDCEKLGLARAYTCPRCRSRDTLKRVPQAILDRVNADRRAAGELVAGDPVPDGDAESHGEVPGA